MEQVFRAPESLVRHIREKLFPQTGHFFSRWPALKRAHPHEAGNLLRFAFLLRYRALLSHVFPQAQSQRQMIAPESLCAEGSLAVSLPITLPVKSTKLGCGATPVKGATHYQHASHPER